MTECLYHLSLSSLSLSLNWPEWCEVCTLPMSREVVQRGLANWSAAAWRNRTTHRHQQRREHQDDTYQTKRLIVIMSHALLPLLCMIWKAKLGWKRKTGRTFPFSFLLLLFPIRPTNRHKVFQHRVNILLHKVSRMHLIRSVRVVSVVGWRGTSSPPSLHSTPFSIDSDNSIE